MNSFPTFKSSDFCYNKNEFTYNANICDSYPINTDCETISEDYKLRCGLCKNYKFADAYRKINLGNGKNLLDMKEQYQRSWYQTGNLGVGILFLLVFIYYQK